MLTACLVTRLLIMDHFHTAEEATESLLVSFFFFKFNVKWGIQNKLEIS